MENNIKKIGILGGSFNPIHNGHLYISQVAVEQLNLDKVIFIPTGKPPHKDSTRLADKNHRFEMTRLAIMDNEKFEISDIEIKNQLTSYSVDTITYIKESFSEEVEIYFITGFDTIVQLDTWKNPEKIATLATIVGVTRGDFFDKRMLTKIEKLKAKYKFNLQIINTMGVNVSSTALRREINNNRSIRYLVPSKVADYIFDNKIYIDTYSDSLIESIKIELQKKLSQKRYIHSVCVADTCKKLGVFYKCDERLLYVCGLLHDYGKELSKKEKKEYCKNNNLHIDKFMKEDIDLAHGLISADLSEKNFKITNIDGLNGIRYHTTGRSNMSLIEKIIFMADCIEPNRNFIGVELLRKLSYEDLDYALIKALEVKIGYAKKRENKIHTLSLEALNDLKNRREKNDKN